MEDILRQGEAKIEPNGVGEERSLDAKVTFFVYFAQKSYFCKFNYLIK